MWRAVPNLSWLYLSPRAWTSGRNQTCDLRLMRWRFYLCTTAAFITFFPFYIPLGTNSGHWTRTLDLRMLRWGLYHFATTIGYSYSKLLPTFKIIFRFQNFFIETVYKSCLSTKFTIFLFIKIGSDIIFEL